MCLCRPVDSICHKVDIMDCVILWLAVFWAVGPTIPKVPRLSYEASDKNGSDIVGDFSQPLTSPSHENQRSTRPCEEVRVPQLTSVAERGSHGISTASTGF